MQFKLERGANSAAAELNDFSFTLEIDNKNVATTKSEIHFVRTDNLAVKTGLVVNGATFKSGAGSTSGIAASIMSGNTILVSGRAMSLTVNGVTKTVTGNRTMTQLATALQAAFAAHTGAAGVSGVKVAFVTGGQLASGLAGQVNATGSINANKGFAVYNANGKDLSVSLSIDQYSGNDVGAAGTQYLNGQRAAAALNLDTTTQTRTSGSLATTGHAASTVASTSTASTVTSGSAVTATLTTANGLTINMTSSAVVSGTSITLNLTTGAVAAGYQDTRIEIAGTYGAAGGATTFTLDNGAEFQIGANASQKDGVTIDSVAATELGRNVTGAGTLTCLEDMLSTKQSALTTGKTTEALKVIDAAIDEVTKSRGKMGAFQANTLETNLNSLRISQENLTAAESVIRDTDFAKESAMFTRNQILTQASQSMLAQANQLPQSVLSLLGR
jgi:flagellin